MADNKPPERPAAEKTFQVSTPGIPGHHLDVGKDVPNVTPEGVELTEAQLERAQAAAKELGVTLKVTEKKGG